MNLSPPISHSDQCYTLIQISDTHLMDDPSAQFVDMNPEQSFHAVMADIQQHYPQAHAIIHTGDLAQVPVIETYQRYLDYMRNLHIASYQIPGNHDDQTLFPFLDQRNDVHIVHLEEWSVLLVNSAVPDHVHGWVSDEHLQQIDDLLHQYSEQHIIIACHHHPIEMQSHWIDQHKLKNTQQLTDLLAKHLHVKLVICGHVHQDSINQWQHVEVMSTPSTCVQFKPKSKDFALDQRAPGYRVLHLFADGRFSTHIHRLNIDQFTINTEISGY